PKALALAARRVELHRIDPGRVELDRISDGDSRVPLDDDSVDYVHSAGVIHHTSNPEAILRELSRVLRPGGSGHLMVYNEDSLWFHLHTAYVKMIIENAFPGLTVREAFAKTTDTEECPIARSYVPDEFTILCVEAGFDVDYVGGYLSQHEL